MKRNTHQLTYPAPYRVSVPTGPGKFVTQPWEAEDVLSTIMAGGHFVKGAHCFAPGVHDFAFAAQDIHRDLMSGRHPNLP